MDNVTHTLAGLLAAELAVRLRARRGEADSPRWARAAWLTSAIANNLPDLDFAYAPLTAGNLGYLLHHRGHTHTLLLAAPQAALAFLLGLLWLRWRAAEASPADRRWLAGLALAGPVLHIAMDAANNYGVHPFWPLDSRWFYGDSVFILEPLYWLMTLPVLLAAARARAGRALLGLLLCGILLAPWLTAFVPAAISAALLAVAAGFSLLVWRLASGGRALAGVVGSLLVTSGFAGASAMARSRAAAIVAEQFPRASLEDLALTPMPANPLCWSLIAVSVEDERLVARRAMLALAPGWMPARRCPERATTPTTAPLHSVDAPPSDAITYRGQFAAPLAELRSLARDNCHVAALLRFARVPFWKRTEDGSLVAGDLRYDRGPKLEFAEIAAEGECPGFVPGWVPPREALLDRGRERR
jgi:inner membrane protein